MTLVVDDDDVDVVVVIVVSDVILALRIQWDQMNLVVFFNTGEFRHTDDLWREEKREEREREEEKRKQGSSIAIKCRHIS